jgi:hypothetical protein
MSTSPKTLRNRNLTAAKRSLKLIRDEVLKHLDILENDGVPESTFTASLAKYETTLIVLRTLDALGKDYVEAGDSQASDGEVSVSRDGLAALIELLRSSEVGFAIHDAKDGSLLSDLINVVAAVYPDGIVPAEQSS